MTGLPIIKNEYLYKWCRFNFERIPSTAQNYSENNAIIK